MFAFATLDTMELVRKEQESDPAIAPIMENLREGNEMTAPFILIGGVVYKLKSSKETGDTCSSCLYVPKSLRDDVMYSIHDAPATGGHFGFKKSYDKMVHRFYWPKMEECLRNYIRECDVCQRGKKTRTKPAGLLEPIAVERPWRMVGIDTVGPLTKSEDGFKYILVATDYFTKWAVTRPVVENTASEAAKFFIEDLFCRFGAIEIILSDRGKNFLSRMMEEVLQTLGAKHYKTSAYHPQTNGLTERVNGILCQALKLYVDENQKNWSKLLPIVTFAYNCTKQTSTKFSPFYLLYGRHPVFPSDLNLSKSPDGFSSIEEYVNSIKSKWSTIQEKVTSAVRRAQQTYKENFDKKRMFRSFAVGDKVLVYTPVRKIGKSEKFIFRNLGPYVVVKKNSDNSYKVRDPSNQNNVDDVHLWK